MLFTKFPLKNFVSFAFLILLLCGASNALKSQVSELEDNDRKRSKRSAPPTETIRLEDETLPRSRWSLLYNPRRNGIEASFE